MKRIFLCLILSGCAQFPNKPICFMDGPDSANCAFTLSGSDFPVDDSGQHNFTQDGRDWNLSDLKKYSLILPPDTQASLQAFAMKYCREHPIDCDATQLQQQIDTFTEKAYVMP